MKQDTTFFEGKDPVLIYIAQRLKDALRLESLLTEANIDYGVQPEHYRGGLIFQSTRIGAFFYVLPEKVEDAHQILRAHGYKPHKEHA